jgi:hypothetical protein
MNFYFGPGTVSTLTAKQAKCRQSDGNQDPNKIKVVVVVVCRQDLCSHSQNSHFSK